MNTRPGISRAIASSCSICCSWHVALLAMMIVSPINNELRGQLLSLFGIEISAAIALSSTTVPGNLLGGIMLRSASSMEAGDFVRVKGQFAQAAPRGAFRLARRRRCPFPWAPGPAFRRAPRLRTSLKTNRGCSRTPCTTAMVFTPLWPPDFSHPRSDCRSLRTVFLAMSSRVPACRACPDGNPFSRRPPCGAGCG